MMKTEENESADLQKAEFKCIVCCVTIIYDAADTAPSFCKRCERRYPPALLKAVIDPFDYALGMRGGTIVQFNRAEIYGNYCTVYREENAYVHPEIKLKGLPFPCPRGIDVRIKDIVWCADAPEGS